MTDKQIKELISDSAQSARAFVQVMRSHAEVSSPQVVFLAVTRALIGWGIAFNVDRKEWLSLVDELWTDQLKRRNK